MEIIRQFIKDNERRGAADPITMADMRRMAEQLEAKLAAQSSEVAGQQVLENGAVVLWTPIGSTEPLSANEVVIMERHNLYPVRDSLNHLKYFVCNGCGLSYTTIQDRTLKPPGVEGCPGCIQRSKWG